MLWVPKNTQIEKLKLNETCHFKTPTTGIFHILLARFQFDLLEEIGSYTPKTNRVNVNFISFFKNVKKDIVQKNLVHALFFEDL